MWGAESDDDDDDADEHREPETETQRPTETEREPPLPGAVPAAAPVLSVLPAVPFVVSDTSKSAVKAIKARTPRAYSNGLRLVATKTERKTDGGKTGAEAPQPTAQTEAHKLVALMSASEDATEQADAFGTRSTQ